LLESYGATDISGDDIDLLPVLFASVPQAATDSIAADPAVESVTADERSQVIDPPAPTGSIQADLPVTSQIVPWGVSRTEGQLAAAEVPQQAQSDVNIAVLDTGIDYTHRDLDGSVAWGANFSQGVEQYGIETATDNHGHGTQAAGLISANNNTYGIVGMAPQSTLYSIKVANRFGQIRPSWLIDGLDAAVKGPDRTIGTADDADVVSMSLGYRSEPFSLEAAINSANQHTILVSAAGNSGDGNPETDNVEYPAKYPASIAVAATAKNDEAASFSSDGPAVEIAAPGVNVNTTDRADSYRQFSGTSAATPIVAGALGLLVAKSEATGADATDAELRSVLHETAQDVEQPGVDNFTGYGLLQAHEATRASAVDATPDQYAVSTGSIRPAIVDSETIVSQNLNFTVTGASNDNVTDTYNVTLTDQAAFTSVSNLSVTDGAGAQINVTSGPTLVDAGSPQNGLTFTIAPNGTDPINNLSVSLSADISYADVSSDTVVPIDVTVTDSANGVAGPTTVTTVSVQSKPTTVSLNESRVAPGTTVRLTVSGTPGTNTTVRIPNSDLVGTGTTSMFLDQNQTPTPIVSTRVFNGYSAALVNLGSDGTAQLRISTTFFQSDNEAVFEVTAGSDRTVVDTLSPAVDRARLYIKAIYPTGDTIDFDGTNTKFDSVRPYVKLDGQWRALRNDDGDVLRDDQISSSGNYGFTVDTEYVFPNGSGTYEIAIVGYNQSENYNINGFGVPLFSDIADTVSTSEFEQLSVIRTTRLSLRTRSLVASLDRQSYASGSFDPLFVSGSSFGHNEEIIVYMVAPSGSTNAAKPCLTRSFFSCPPTSSVRFPYRIDLTSALTSFTIVYNDDGEIEEVITNEPALNQEGEYRIFMIGWGQDDSFDGPSDPLSFAETINVQSFSQSTVVDRLREEYGDNSDDRVVELTFQSGASTTDFDLSTGAVVLRDNITISGPTNRGPGALINVTLTTSPDSDLIPPEELYNTSTVAQSGGRWSVTIPFESFPADEYRLIVNESELLTPNQITIRTSDPLSVPPLPGRQTSPQNVDSDIELEDIDGDGTFDIFDIQRLFNNLDSPAVQDYPAAFDFDESGGDEVDIFDVQALFQELTAQ
jgi:subtilisin family serine protease